MAAEPSQLRKGSGRGRTTAALFWKSSAATAMCSLYKQLYPGGSVAEKPMAIVVKASSQDRKDKYRGSEDPVARAPRHREGHIWGVMEWQRQSTGFRRRLCHLPAG